MANITLSIPDAKVQRVVDALKGLYPIPMLADGVTPEYTDSQWAKECIRRWIVEQVHRWENQVAMDAATVSKDDLIAG